jgi:hypothetical protein
MAALALPITLVARYSSTRSWSECGRDLLNKALIGVGILLMTAFYWAPLARSIYRYGSESAQNVWFGYNHADLTSPWTKVSLESMLVFLGLFFVFYLWREWKGEKLPYLFLGGLLVILVDRVFNLGGSSIQSRKIIEFAHVFAMAPLAIGLVAVWEKLARHSQLVRGITGALLVVLLIFANAQTELRDSRFYRIAVNQRVPEKKLEVFQAVSTDHTVFLTDRYSESCYLPYFLFINYNNMTAHTAGRYSQREHFLDEAITIADPELLAYVFAYNRYSPIDYVYLPKNKKTGKWEQKLYQVSFLKKKGKVKTITYVADYMSKPDIFVERHDLGMYEIVAPQRTKETDQLIKDQYPDIYWHLAPEEG